MLILTVFDLFNAWGFQGINVLVEYTNNPKSMKHLLAMVSCICNAVLLLECTLQLI